MATACDPVVTRTSGQDWRALQDAEHAQEQHSQKPQEQTKDLAREGTNGSLRSRSTKFSGTQDQSDSSRAAVPRSGPRSIGFARQKPPVLVMLSRSNKQKSVDSRGYHSSARRIRGASVAAQNEESEVQLAPSDTQVPGYEVGDTQDLPENPNGIRAQLRKWQGMHGHEEEVVPEPPSDDNDDLSNGLGRLPEDAINGHQSAEDRAEEERLAYFSGLGQGSKEGFEGSSSDSKRFLQPGDLAELQTKDERDGTLAVFVRYVTTTRNLGQFFTSHGRWVHFSTTLVPYSIPNWIDPKLLEPLKRYLPEPGTLADIQLLSRQAITEDMDVPREVAGALVQKLVAFNDEVQQIYRRHSNALDNAHDYLAHETDLRYGSVVSAATALLKIPADRLPLAALIAVRRALSNGGLAFNIDKKSHRVTGYMQIRSKEQVRMVETVRNWIRQWQDDQAKLAGMSSDRAARHRPSYGAAIVNSFLEKSRQIVLRNRQDRVPDVQNANLTISKTRLSLDKSKECIVTQQELVFSEAEEDLVKFIEGWCCSLMFLGLPRLESLPPLLLGALDLYNELDLQKSTGFLFLQELGAIMPWENRVRYDQHLLLPSSQHSRPLQQLMTNILKMRHDHNFRDSMSEHRRDWGSLPVYCIDSSSAQEIDDGISVERAEDDADGREQHWIHIHIANPTAFFSRNHPLAKMARHMGETIYMPERAYLMLPRWASARHFSLAPERPCLTFSTKVDLMGNTKEEKITPGFIRNVIRLTYDEVQGILGDTRTREDWFDIIVGADTAPTGYLSRSDASKLDEKNRQELNILHNLARGLQEARRRAGGIFFEMERPEISVWQTWRKSGLGWEHPWRKGSRTVTGDPVIHVRTHAMSNWFSAERSPSTTLVSEAMLLCSKIAAKYCADRDIPIIYRGTHPHLTEQSRTPSPEVLAGAELIRQGKDIPMYLGIPYLQSRGFTHLQTSPFHHDFLGMDYYSKVTSPLRRYGDMILHWQIEAAIRHEAETGKSLLVAPEDRNRDKHDRSFLPFSKETLETIMVGLQPREDMVNRAKTQSEQHWHAMWLYRKFWFKENGALPFDKLHVFLTADPRSLRCDNIPAMNIEMNIGMLMLAPKKEGLEEPMAGDIWEVELVSVNIYSRLILAMPKRLVNRNGM